MIFFSVSENKAFVLFCQLFIIVKCMDFSEAASVAEDIPGYNVLSTTYNEN